MKKFLKFFLCLVVISIGCLIAYKTLASSTAEILDIGYNQDSGYNYILYDDNVLSYWGSSDTEILEIDDVIDAGFTSAGIIWYINLDEELYIIGINTALASNVKDVVPSQNGIDLYIKVFDNPDEKIQKIEFSGITPFTTDIYSVTNGTLDFKLNGETLVISKTINVNSHETTTSLLGYGPNIFGTDVTSEDNTVYTVFNNISDFGEDYAVSNGNLYQFSNTSNMKYIISTNKVLFHEENYIQNYWIISDDGFNGDLYYCIGDEGFFLKENIVYDYQGFNDLDGYEPATGNIVDIEYIDDDMYGTIAVSYKPYEAIDGLDNVYHTEYNWIQYDFDTESYYVSEPDFTESFEGGISPIKTDRYNSLSINGNGLLVDGVLYTYDSYVPDDFQIYRNDTYAVKMMDNVKSIDYITSGFIITNDNQVLRYGLYSGNELGPSDNEDEIIYESYIPVLIKEHNFGSSEEVDPISVISYVINTNVPEEYIFNDFILFNDDKYNIKEDELYYIYSYVVPYNATNKTITYSYDNNKINYDSSNSTLEYLDSGENNFNISIDNTEFTSKIVLNNYSNSYSSIELDSLVDKDISSDDIYAYQNLTGTILPENISYVEDEVVFEVYYNDELTFDYLEHSCNKYDFCTDEYYFDDMDDNTLLLITNYDDNDEKLDEDGNAINRGLYFYAPGVYKIVAKSLNNDEIKSEVTVNISKKSSEILLNNYKDYFILDTNENKYQLSLSIYPSDTTNKNVTYVSSDESVATVNDSGLITVLKEGTTNITVTAVDGGATITKSFEVIKKGMDGIKGDVTGDNKVNISDLTKIRMYLSGKITKEELDEIEETEE